VAFHARGPPPLVSVINVYHFHSFKGLSISAIHRSLNKYHEIPSLSSTTCKKYQKTSDIRSPSDMIRRENTQYVRKQLTSCANYQESRSSIPLKMSYYQTVRHVGYDRRLKESCPTGTGRLKTLALPKRAVMQIRPAIIGGGRIPLRVRSLIGGYHSRTKKKLKREGNI